MAGMEQRAEPRLATNQEVRFTVLGPRPSESVARIVNASGAGVRLELDRAVKPGTPVKIEYDDTLLLGETCYCQRSGEAFAVGVQMDQALLHTEELARLSQRLLDEEEGSSNRRESANPVVDRDQQHR